MTNKKQAKLKTTRRQHNLHHRYEQPPVARRRNERRNTIQGAPGNERVGRGIEVRAEKEEGNALHHHPSEKRNTRRTFHLRKETLVLRKMPVLNTKMLPAPSTEILVQNNMKILVQSIAKIQVLNTTELTVLSHTGIVVQNTETPDHQNQRLFQRDIVALVQQLRLNQSAIAPLALVMIVQQKDIPKRSTLIRSIANMMRFHQTRVLFRVKAQKHLELIGKDLALQPTMATLQNSGRETTVCIILKTDRQNPQTMVILGEGFDHHRLTTEEGSLDGHH